MRRATVWLMLLVFLALSLPAALWAGGEDERPRRPGRPAFDGRPPVAGTWPSKPLPPGFKPPFQRPPRPPQWSLGISNRPVRPPYNYYDSYKPCPPYCGYTVYLNERREEEETRTKDFPTENETPEETTYFQGGGNFERMDEGAAAPPPAAAGDNSQMDLESYRLMMKAWQ